MAGLFFIKTFWKVLSKEKKIKLGVLLGTTLLLLIISIVLMARGGDPEVTMRTMTRI